MLMLKTVVQDAFFLGLRRRTKPTCLEKTSTCGSQQKRNKWPISMKMLSLTIDQRDTNKIRICLLPIKLAESKKLVISSVSKNVETWDLLCSLGETTTWYKFSDDEYQVVKCDYAWIQQFLTLYKRTALGETVLPGHLVLLLMGVPGLQILPTLLMELCLRKILYSW